MQNKKNIGTLLYALLLMFSITACGNQTTPISEIDESQTALEEGVKILSQDLVTSIFTKEIEDSFDQEVSFEKNRDEADVFYTTDANIYNVENFEKYTKPFIVRENKTVRYFSSYAGVKENIQSHTVIIDEQGLLDFVAGQESVAVRDKTFFGEVETFLNSFEVEPSIIKEVKNESILRKFQQEDVVKIREDSIIKEENIDEKELDEGNKEVEIEEQEIQQEDMESSKDIVEEVEKEESVEAQQEEKEGLLENS